MFNLSVEPCVNCKNLPVLWHAAAGCPVNPCKVKASEGRIAWACPLHPNAFKRRKSISRPKRSQIGCLMAPIQRIFKGVSDDRIKNDQKWFWMSKSSQHQTWIWPWRTIWFVMLRQPNCPCIIARKFSGLTSLAKCWGHTVFEIPQCLANFWSRHAATNFVQPILPELLECPASYMWSWWWHWNAHNDRNWIPWCSNGFLVVP